MENNYLVRYEVLKNDIKECLMNANKVFEQSFAGAYCYDLAEGGYSCIDILAVQDGKVIFKCGNEQKELPIISNIGEDEAMEVLELRTLARLLTSSLFVATLWRLLFIRQLRNFVGWFWVAQA